MSTVNPEIEKIQQAIKETSIESERAAVGEQEIRLETGEVYKGTPSQILEELKKGKVEASKTIRATRDQMEQLQREINALKSSQATPAAPTNDNTQYYETWAKNPADATVMALAEKVGMSPEQLVNTMKSTMATSAVNNASSEFLARCSDFPESRENGLLLAEAHRRRYGADVTAMTADNLELTYRQLVREGKLTPRQVNLSENSSPITPMPNLRGQSVPNSPETDLLTAANAMPLEQLEATLKRLRAQQG